MNMTRQAQPGKRWGLMTLGALAVSAMLAACGGASDSSTTVAGPTALQAQKEQAALARAKAMNADAMGKITAERAGGQ